MNNNEQVKNNQKRNLIVLVVICAIDIIGIIYLFPHSAPTDAPIETQKSNFINPLKRIDAESIVVEKAQKELRETKHQTHQLEEKYNSLSIATESQDKMVQQNNDELKARIAALEKQLATITTAVDLKNSQPAAMPGSNQFQGNFLGSASNQSIQPQVMNASGIREDRLTLVPRDDDSHLKPLKNPDTFVPAGSFVEAVMLSGADASAAVNSQSNPDPLVFRITDNGSMPNKTSSHLKGCRVTAAVVGDISSERGKIRLERLSCTFPNGETVEQEVEGTIEGPDGKNGIRGNAVWRDGAITQRVFTAGFLSGVANGVSNSFTTNSVSAEGAVQTVNAGKIFQNSAASGGSKAMDKLSNYYIQRAEQYHPIVQLSAGAEVNILFLKGFFLDGKSHENPDKSVGNYAAQERPSLYSNSPFAGEDLPLSPEKIKRIEAHSKELGLNVTPLSNMS